MWLHFCITPFSPPSISPNLGFRDLSAKSKFLAVSSCLNRASLCDEKILGKGSSNLPERATQIESVERQSLELTMKFSILLFLLFTLGSSFCFSQSGREASFIQWVHKEPRERGPPRPRLLPTQYFLFQSSGTAGGLLHLPASKL